MSNKLSRKKALNTPSGPSAAQVHARFIEAITLHQQGQISHAQAIYEEIIKVQPNHFDSLHFLGVIAIQTSNYRRAVDLIGNAIKISPNNAGFHSNLGNALHELKQLDAALASYNKAIELKPDYAGAYYNRGIILYELKKFDKALANFNRAIDFNPGYAEAYYNRGNALKELDRFEAALASYDKAITLCPDYPEAYCNRGIALKGLGQFVAALASYDHAIELRPRYAEAYYNRGNVLQEFKHFDTALTSYDKALAINPNYTVVFLNKGNALQELNQFDAAIASYNKVIELQPDYAEAYSNRGNAFQELKQLDAALASHDKAIEIDPDYAEAYWNKSLALLLAGDFDKGWELYEWRWKNEKNRGRNRHFPQPLWLGSEVIAGKTILLHCEQGFGDTIQFCRYARLVSELGAQVVMEVPKPLVSLLTGLTGVAELVEQGTTLPEFDYHCPLLSLPLAFKTKIDTIPSSETYIRSDASKVASWTKRLGEKTRQRVGIVWSGRPTHKNDHNRSLLLADLIAGLPTDFEYVSLQKDVRDVDNATLKEHPEIRSFGEDLTDFSETAALCELMDVVISVDTSVAHLSGAIGKPTWVMLPASPDWRWLLDRCDSPWYPSVKLYRQESFGEWSGVLSEVNADLTNIVDRFRG